MKKIIQIEVDMWTDASEADLSEHMRGFVNEIECHAKNLSKKEWYTNLNTDWDEHYHVNIEVDVKITEKS